MVDKSGVWMKFIFALNAGKYLIRHISYMSFFSCMSSAADAKRAAQRVGRRADRVALLEGERDVGAGARERRREVQLELQAYGFSRTSIRVVG